MVRIKLILCRKAITEEEEKEDDDDNDDDDDDDGNDNEVYGLCGGDSELGQLLLTCGKLSNQAPSVESRLNGSCYSSV